MTNLVGDDLGPAVLDSTLRAAVVRDGARLAVAARDAGYDPREALAFWKRMEKVSSGGGQPPEFLSTHPSHGTREDQIQAWLPEALRYYEASARAPNEKLVSATHKRVVLVRSFAR